MKREVNLLEHFQRDRAEGKRSHAQPGPVFAGRVERVDGFGEELVELRLDPESQERVGLELGLGLHHGPDISHILQTVLHQSCNPLAKVPISRGVVRSQPSSQEGHELGGESNGLEIQ